jgi:arginine decarboxylase
MSEPLSMPLVAQLLASADRDTAPFHTPGHKQGQGIPAVLRTAWGEALFRADLPELPELDNLYTPAGVIAQAQAQAAHTFGADRTWFLVNGSTVGILASILATCGPGDKLLLPRTAHRSAIAACILSGAVPVFLMPSYNRELDVVGTLTPATVEQALAEHADAKAILLVSPTYDGMCADVRAIAHLAHTHKLPLVVDEAHGPHLGFHPDLPASALQSGADVVVQSTHKVLAGLTQAAMLHQQGAWVEGERLGQALGLLQTSSPSYLLLASLDAARAQMASQGHDLLAQTLELVGTVRHHLQALSGLRLLSPQALGAWAYDPTRLLVNVAQLGCTGYAADAYLHGDLGVTAELPSLHNLTFLFSLGNTPRDAERLIAGLRQLVAHPPREPVTGCFSSLGELWDTSQPVAGRSPRDAFFGQRHRVPLELAIGAYSAELICPYPPGIPVLLPGEGISEAAVHYLLQVQASGGTISGCADPSLKTVQILEV